MNWFRRMMYGRNGQDALGTFTLVLILIVSLLTRVLPGVLRIVFVAGTYALLFIFFVRMFSHNLPRRHMENQRFLQLCYSLKKGFKIRTRRISECRTHKYFRCPECKRWLRVPRGKGNIQIHCRDCGTVFDART